MHLESEQESALELAKNFVASRSSIDINSDAFDALPIRAQLQVILILQDTSIDASPQVKGETFSQAQIKRLMMRRELSRKKEEIESRMNESLIAEAVPKEIQSTSDMVVRAFRIASQDEGHAILLKRRSSKENADDLRARLNRILVRSPGSDLNSDEKVTSEPNTVTELTKMDPDSTDQNGRFGSDEVKVKEGSSESEATSTDTDDFVDVEAGSEDIKTLDNLVLRLIQSREAGTSSSTNKNRVIVAKQPVKTGDVESITSDEESNLEESSSEETYFTDVTDQSVSIEHFNGFSSCVDQSTSSENLQNLMNHAQPPLAKKIVKEELSAKKVDGKIAFVGKVPDSEVKDEFSREESLPQISSFLAPGFDEIEDNLEIDDSVLRLEADRFERLAQETTSDCVAEAQRLVELFGFPVVTSPEEAEAQCCRLQQLGLVDIVASDDSDVWVFGLDRRHLIQLAMLCGSDYTNGIDKIGPIKAVEIVAFFCRSYNHPNSTEIDAVLQPLLAFREFCLRGTDSRWKNIKVPDDFPNEMVVKGYLSPNVEEPKEFHWDTPQMALLTKYPFHKFKSSLEHRVSRTPQIVEFFPHVDSQLKPTSRLTQATYKLKYAKEFENLPNLADNWSADEESQEGNSSNLSRKRKSTEEPKTVTKRRRRKARPKTS
ncbi:unnamed protein product [Rodentolepis nana]|uniref:XPG-I domain-containing protein n=1 Tax=Rodentolepis nana TaxID=102285 RepID=A0A3P7SSR7_RODNA|nr:unnamed protein product [Rodentolepis nana]